MPVLRVLLIPLVAVVFATSAQAGPFFKRPMKPDPAEHVPALINTLKTDPDERKRAAAVDELSKYDVKNFPDMLPAWIEALQHDSSQPVRIAAVIAIGEMRP